MSPEDESETLFSVTSQQRTHAPPAEREAVVRALPLSFRDDAALAQAAAEGHPAAAREIWDRHAATVRGLLRRMVGAGDLDDLVQETFLRFFDNVSRLREPDKLTSFLIGISVRIAREELRRRRVRRWLTLRPPPSMPEPVTSTDFEAAEALRRLYEILDRLDPDTRLVFVLRYVEDIPASELTEVLGCSLATAKRRVKRATELIEKMAVRDPTLMAFVQADRKSGPHERREP
ncbi:MAG TPA: sigma-70 family RNA polymerase sigma factor [Polyangiaceae bacterium]|jgi:RNA polymerase sigma-70 factor (ECF subfamily)|nr:sigma-70 family RNA polymerase sigma factor [Polyangiaceae bacterium]